MQFHLRTLLIFTTVAAVVCGTFVAPPGVAVPVLCLILWTSPAFWISGAFISRGRRQAFFVGASLAGIAPYLSAVILSIVYYLQWIAEGDWPDILEQGDNRWAAFRVAMAVYLPGMCSLIGGGLGLLAYRYHDRSANPAGRIGLMREEAGE